MVGTVPSDVNGEMAEHWVADTDPAERVWSVIRGTYDATLVSDISERARTDEETTQDYLRLLARASVVERVVGETGEAFYWRSSESAILEQARAILKQKNGDELADRIEVMREDLEPYRGEADGRWKTPKLNLAIGEVALALEDAERRFEKTLPA
jgi:hypothetical protein